MELEKLWVLDSAKLWLESPNLTKLWLEAFAFTPPRLLGQAQLWEGTQKEVAVAAFHAEEKSEQLLKLRLKLRHQRREERLERAGLHIGDVELYEQTVVPLLEELYRRHVQGKPPGRRAY